eukprot:TRINITY_DN11865_c0_g1_i1.p1 TRINITY_DN11865_c0_g1~~TRINITY_DN11865_c0_g1_i1.p1  ORF type:complete len:975 (-),score=191.55 TRINITY_DN11865_c0_g1_i1:18-2942(-)
MGMLCNGVCLLILLSFQVLVHSLNNGVGLTPPMGWNSFVVVGTGQQGMTADVVMGYASSLSDSVNGLSKFGYTYIVLEGAWAKTDRANNGQLQVTDNFPKGMKDVVDKVHNLGLKMGLSTDAGYTTCQGYPGFEGHEQQDAQAFAGWGVDYLEIYNCNYDPDGPDAQERYGNMTVAVQAAGRPMFLSMRDVNGAPSWAAEYVNAWNPMEEQDIADAWHSVLWNLDNVANLYLSAGPGGWNNPNFLEIGQGSMTLTEYKTQFTLWCILKAPLFFSAEIPQVDSDYYNILSNAEAIAVSQDPRGAQGKRISTTVPRYTRKRDVEPLDLQNYLVATSCDNTMISQKWQVWSNGTITSALDGRCITILNCDDTSYVTIGVSECLLVDDGTCNYASQFWDFHSTTITSRYSGACMDINDNQGPLVVGTDCVEGEYQQQIKYNSQTGALYSLATPKFCLAVKNGQEIWAAPMSDNSFAIVLFNRNDLAYAPITVQWKNVFPTFSNYTTYNYSFAVRDLWLHQDQGFYSSNYSAVVEPHGVVMLRVTPTPPYVPPPPFTATTTSASTTGGLGTTATSSHTSTSTSTTGAALVPPPYEKKAPAFSTLDLILTVAIGGGGLLIILITVAIVLAYKSKSKKKDKEEDKENYLPPLPPPLDLPPPDISLSSFPNSSLKLSGLITNENKDIFLTKLKKGKVIGAGAFGQVLQADWNGVHVAMKCVASDKLTELKEEAHILQKLLHPNIVQFFGLYEDPNDNRLYIVTEFMPNGSLDKVLKAPNAKSTITPQIILKMCRDCAAGMALLENNQIVHCDLSCRNLLVNIKYGYLVKITDFGLSRSSENSTIDKFTALPIKWCSPETIKDLRFTSKSDVWSFGVVVWEMTSFGKTPYPGMNNQESFEWVKAGNRLSFPPQTHPKLVQLVLDCWEAIPENRPNFSEILARIDEIILEVSSPTPIVFAPPPSAPPVPSAPTQNVYQYTANQI